MKILYICTYYHRAMVFYDSAEALRRRGHQVSIFSAAVKGDAVQPKYAGIMDNNVIHRECYKKHDRFFFFKKQKKLQEAIESVYDISSFDLIHSHTLFNGGYAAYKLSVKYNIPFVVSVRNTDINAFMKIPGFKGLAGKILLNAAGSIFISEAAKENVLNKYSYLKEKIGEKAAVVYVGLESYWLNNIASEAKKLNHIELKLICVGKIDRNKNMLSVLKAVNNLNNENIPASLYIAGNVVDKKVEKALSESNRVTMFPYMTKEELVKVYQSMDIFIMTSISETFGRVYAEAMTQALPVIYTQNQGFDGIFPSGTVGYAVKPFDIRGIAEAVKKIKSNYNAISENCLDNCKIFNWDTLSEKIEKFYDRALKPSN